MDTTRWIGTHMIMTLLESSYQQRHKRDDMYMHFQTANFKIDGVIVQGFARKTEQTRRGKGRKQSNTLDYFAIV